MFDPARAGVLEAITSGKYPVSSQVLARLDMEAVTSQSSKPKIMTITEWLAKHMKSSANADGHQKSFSGIIISNWEDQMSVALLEQYISLVSSLGLGVYLECAAPQFLVDVNLATMPEITGLVIRNGTISENGEERDAFQMNEMRPTIKAFVSQACLRSFVVLLWETLYDDAMPLNAVIKRSYQWSKFYSALPWIGSISALTSARLSLNQTEPLGAFDWLKELRVMNFHEKWRGNQSVSLFL